MRKRVLQLGLALLAATRVGSASAGEIHDAVLVHDIERVRQLLLEKPALVNERTEKGDTPLYIAAFRGYVKQMVPLLLQFGADPNPPPNLRMETPLSIARELNMKQTAAMLLKAGAREDDISRAAELRYFAMKRDADALTERLNQNRRLVNSRNAYGQTPLALAMGTDKPDFNSVLALLNAGADPNATNLFGGTPYSVAVEREHANFVTVLSHHGGKENTQTRTAPLRMAARKNLLADAEALLKRDATLINATDELRRTPLHLACASGELPLIELLLKAGADVNARDFADNTPLHAAALARKTDLVTALLARKADPNTANRQRATPLHQAATFGPLPLVEALLKAGANVKATDNIGETALHRAATGGQTVLVKRFLEAGLDVNTRDMQRQTALHQAAQAGHGDVVRLLLAHGANPAFTDVSGSTALALAEKRKAEEVAKLLRAGPPK